MNQTLANSRASIDTRDLKTLEASRRVEDGRWQDPAYQARLRMKARLGAGFINLANSLVRIEKVGFEKFVAAAAGPRPCVIVAWHSSLVSSIYCHRRRNIVIMTSLSQDGDLLTQILYRLGYKCVRGSSSRGGMRGLLEMVKLMRNGQNGAITVDGPRGPRHEVKPGAVLVSQKADALLVPIGLAYSNCIRLNNWDKTEVPLPGSKVVMVTGDPFAVSPETSIEEGCELIRKAIVKCEQEAELIVKQ
jgi:lysophospholipid acyltransferase (LPLAT)-like uncharacterized protein